MNKKHFIQLFKQKFIWIRLICLPFLITTLFLGEFFERLSNMFRYLYVNLIKRI